jgi:hypothetical protein
VVLREAAYAMELGEETFERQVSLPERNVERGEQLKLVDAPRGERPTPRELYEQERAARAA